MSRVPIYVIFNVDPCGYLTKITSNTQDGIKKDETVDKVNVKQGNFDCLKCNSQYRMKFYFKFPTEAQTGKLMVRYEGDTIKVEENDVAKEVKDFMKEIEEYPEASMKRVIQMKDDTIMKLKHVDATRKRKAPDVPAERKTKKQRAAKRDDVKSEIDETEWSPMEVESLIEYADEIPCETLGPDDENAVNVHEPKTETKEEQLEEMDDEQNNNEESSDAGSDYIIDGDRPWWDPLVKDEHVKYFNANSECTICGVVVPGRPSYKRWNHLSDVHQIYKVMCDICGKLLSGSSLAKHRRMHEKSGIRVMRERKKPETHYCDLCKDTFHSLPAWERHQKNVHGIQPLYRCESCPYFTKKHRNLENHVKRVHTESQDLPYSCTFCNRRFAENHYLRMHLLTHSEKRSFECELCHNKYKRKTELVQHMYIHTGEMPYECRFCFKRFNDRGNKNAHQRRVHPLEYEKYKHEKVEKGKWRGMRYDLE